jgi:hypothetical protein
METPTPWIGPFKIFPELRIEMPSGVIELGVFEDDLNLSAEYSLKLL